MKHHLRYIKLYRKYYELCHLRLSKIREKDSHWLYIHDNLGEIYNEIREIEKTLK